ncbi:LIM/homeobox protein arrowhead isoform X1 [Osmia lignaria lignaria]|uniref:LIM/homeobox protein arrowhead isoform X1 n=1 Tax=Osmia lignaria lignaria TaxID=1437193 RepID=UPI00402B12D8
MSTFTENPFFFFVDNVPPISPNNLKNARRIVELSDTGCDARLSVSSLLRKATRYYSSKSAKMRANAKWRSRCEERLGNGERFRGQYEQNTINNEQLYFMPEEAETNKNHWQEYSTYEDRDFRMNSRITPERLRHNTNRYDYPNHSQLPRFNYSRNNFGIYDQETFHNRGGSRFMDYPKDFKETSRNLNGHKDHWQRDNNEDIHTKVFHDSSRYNSRETMTNDRRKRTQPTSKIFYENAESQYDIQTFQNSACMTSKEEISNPSRSTEKIKQFVDRAVDKDSLSDIVDESNIATAPSVVKDEGNQIRNSFWEFISLEEDNDKKTKRPSWPLKTKRLTKSGSSDPKTKKRMEQRSIQNIPSNNVAEDVVENITDNNKVGMNFMEKTMACLKRKLDKPKVEEPLSQSYTLSTEKKIRSQGSTHSRLPVRIGGRHRSKNPVARIRSNVKGHTVGEEENKNTAGLERNSVRSRTKPKEKPSVLQNEDVVGPLEAAEYSKSVGHVQQTTGINSCLNRNQKGDENFIENNVSDELYDEQLMKDEKLEGNVNNKVTGDSTIINVTRGKKTIRRNSLAKEIDISRDGLKENCFFHLHDEDNIVCNSYCKTDCNKLDCLESTKPTAIKSRL